MFHLNNYIACEELSYDSSSSHHHHLRHIEDAMTYVAAHSAHYLLWHQGGVELNFKRKQTHFSPFSWHTSTRPPQKIHRTHHRPHGKRQHNALFTAIKMHRRFLNIIFIYRTRHLQFRRLVCAVHSVTKAEQQSTIVVCCAGITKKQNRTHVTCLIKDGRLLGECGGVYTVNKTQGRQLWIYIKSTAASIMMRVDSAAAMSTNGDEIIV